MVDISKYFHVSNCTVANYLHKNGIQTKTYQQNHSPNSSHKHFFKEKELNEIIRLYTIEHLASTEIGKRFNVSFPTIIRLLKAHGIHIIDSRHDKSNNKLSIKDNEIPPLFKNVTRTRHQLTAEVSCPICHKARTLVLSRQRIKELIERDGKCKMCNIKTKTKPINIAHLKRLYDNGLMTTNQLSKQFGICHEKLKQIMIANNIQVRPKGLTTLINYRKRINYKEDTSNPQLGDICRGTDIGLYDSAYYKYVSCPSCHNSRWQALGHAKRSTICRECSLKLMGINHRGEYATNWHGGKSFEPYTPVFSKYLKNEIRARDNHACQLCGKPQNGIALAVHHIDYDKKNCKPENLISLCQTIKGQLGCHIKTNSNRQYWTQYFRTLLIEKGIATPDSYAMATKCL